MCIRDSDYSLNLTFNTAQKRNVRVAMSNNFGFGGHNATIVFAAPGYICLLYTSDAADDLLCVDLGGRRIIKKKKYKKKI